MKNSTKAKILAGVMAVLTLAPFPFLLAGCPQEVNDDNEVKERTTTKSLFGGISSVSVKGNFTKAELETAAGKIAGRLNALFDNDKATYGEEAAVEFYKGIFNRGVTYIVELNPVGYNNYKTIGDGKTVYIALDKVDTEYVVAGVRSINNNASEVSKAIDPSREMPQLNRQVIAFGNHRAKTLAMGSQSRTVYVR